MTNINFPSLILALFPALFILGSASLNFILVLILIFFFWYIISKKIPFTYLYDEKWKFLFIIFFFYSVVVNNFAIDNYNGLRSSISQIRFFIFTLFLFYFVDTKFLKSLIIPIWTVIILLVCLDTNLQFITGIDIFGYRAEGFVSNERILFSKEIGRLSGPFGKELIVGSFISKISAPLIFYFLAKLKNFNYRSKIITILFLILIFETVLITGERTSFVITLLTFILGFFYSLKFRTIIISFLVILISFYMLFINTNFLKLRYVEAYKILNDIPDSSYGRIYSSSLAIWKNDLAFGVGNKNYYVNCKKLIDPNPQSIHSYCSPTHSHNNILQLLVELGLIGTIIFYIFIIYLLNFFYKRKNYFKLLNQEKKTFFCGSAVVSIYYIFPSIIPTGSLFTTWNATFFWLHLGIMLSIIRNYEK